jgi:hypothetical protein
VIDVVRQPFPAVPAPDAFATCLAQLTSQSGILRETLQRVSESARIAGRRE